MLSYQHAYHAGSISDMHKHSALLLLIAALKLKSQPIHYFESHAGRAVYDLLSEQARKTQEAARGLLAISQPEQAQNGSDKGDNFSRYLALNANPQCYLGSPALAAAQLRAQDRLLLCELHPQEFRALSAWSEQDKRIKCIQQDGYRVAAELPVDPRLLVFIDPSYETQGEFEAAGKLALQLHQDKQATVLLWYPLLRDRRHNKLVSILQASGLGLVLHDQLLFAPLKHKDSAQGQEFYGMQGSGLMLLSTQTGALRRAIKANSLALAKALPEERQARVQSALLNIRA